MTQDACVLSLSDDLLIEILGSLSALDVLRCRKVCRRFEAVSRSSSVWSSIYRGTTCLLPRRNDKGLTKALEFEETLRRAEAMEQIWSGAQPNDPELQAIITHPLPIPSTCIGLAGRYAVFVTNRFLEGPTYRWYEVISPTGGLNFALEYTPVPNEKESKQKIWHGHYIEAGTNVLNIATIYLDDLTGYQLQIIEATICPEVTLDITVKPFIQLSCLTDAPRRRIVGTLNSDFLHLRYANGPQDTVGEGRVLLVHMRTGKVIVSFPHEFFSPPSNALSFMHKRLDIFVTDSYLIQVVQGGHFEFFELPAQWDESEEIISSQRTPFTGSFPLHLLAVWRIFPSSPTQYAVLGLSSPGFDAFTPPPSPQEYDSRVVLFTIDISSGHAAVTQVRSWSYGILAQVSHFKLSPDYYPTPTSVMGIVVLRNHNHELHHLMVRVTFAGSDSEEPTLTFTKIAMPGELLRLNNENAGFFYLWADPFSGLLVGQSFGSHSTGSTLFIIKLFREYVT